MPKAPPVPQALANQRASRLRTCASFRADIGLTDSTADNNTSKAIAESLRALTNNLSEWDLGWGYQTKLRDAAKVEVCIQLSPSWLV